MVSLSSDSSDFPVTVTAIELDPVLATVTRLRVTVTVTVTALSVTVTALSVTVTALSVIVTGSFSAAFAGRRPIMGTRDRAAPFQCLAELR